jgi:hypothetical protein
LTRVSNTNNNPAEMRFLFAQADKLFQQALQGASK